MTGEPPGARRDKLCFETPAAMIGKALGLDEEREA